MPVSRSLGAQNLGGDRLARDRAQLAARVAVATEKLGDLLGGQRSREVEALGEGAAALHEEAALGLGLDALGDRSPCRARRPAATMAVTIAAACGLRGTPRMNERSIFSSSTGSSRRRVSDE